MPNKKSKTKPTPSAKNQTRYTYSMYPGLHKTVAPLLKGDNLFFTFHNDDDEHGCTQTYDTNIMGRFKCRNVKCGVDGWASRMIAITIRQYPGRTYNARVYHQRCQGCSQVSRPFLDGSYGERIAYRLRKWSGIEVERLFYSNESRGPHQRSLCEGCKAGHCSQAKKDMF